MPAESDHFATAEECVREGDKDRFLASLFVPAEKRAAIFALYAFNHEIASIRERVSEPGPGEMRLQWWREVLAGERAGETSAHPVARAITETLSTYHMAPAPLISLVDARAFDLYDDPMPTLNDLEGYCGETASILFQLAATILNDGVPPASGDAAGHGGVAYALTGILRAFPIHKKHGQRYLPGDLVVAHGLKREDILAEANSAAVSNLYRSIGDIARDHLAKARAAIGDMPDSTRIAFLPLAIVEPCLDAFQKHHTGTVHTPGDLPQWRRQWAIWRGSRRLRRVGTI